MLEVLRKLAKKKAPPPICSAVIVAAGSARRMEGIDKVLAPLGELPVLVHTIYSFQDCPRFDEIVVVTREDLLVEVSRICKDFQLDKVSKVVVGGRERTDSVLAGLREVRPAPAHWPPSRCWRRWWSGRRKREQPPPLYRSQIQ